MAIIISDIHGDIKKAKAFLDHKPEAEHVILGDLMDSRDCGVTLDDELGCLELIFKSDAVLLWGNHDLAYTDKPCWPPYARLKNTYEPISELLTPHQNRFKVAHSVDGWLCTHAGVSTMLAKQLPGMPLDSGDPAVVAAWINEQFQHQSQIRKNRIGGKSYFGTGPLFAIDWTRGGDDQFGGIFWYDPQRELTKPDPRVKQLFGHTPVPGPLKRDEWNNINIEGGLVLYGFDTDVQDFIIIK